MNKIDERKKITKGSELQAVAWLLGEITAETAFVDLVHRSAPLASTHNVSNPLLVADHTLGAGEGDSADPFVINETNWYRFKSLAVTCGPIKVYLLDGDAYVL